MLQFKNKSFERQARKFHNYYLNRFMSMKCAPDLLLLGMFPNAKEITESFAAFEAMTHLPYDFKDDIQIVVVGDGTKPRTGAVFAFRSAWSVISLDPLMKKTDYDIKRLTAYQARMEDLTFEFDKPTVIVCVHSHAKLSVCLERIKAPKRYLINIPCCVKPDIGIPMLRYDDPNLQSEKNTVEIYVL